jgi:hypothetical protein
MKNMPAKPTDEEIETTEPKKETSDKEVTSVPLSEDFQKRVMEIIGSCTEDECDFISDHCRVRADEIRKEKQAKNKKGKDGKGEPTMDDYQSVMSDY